jgi:hypothetical protein
MKNKGGKYFWRGIKHDIPLCCIMFYETAWQSIRKNNPMYGETMHKLSNNEGIIFCPECLTKNVTDLS